MATYKIRSADGKQTYNITLPDDQPPQQQPYSGAILPFSKDAQGNVSLDIDAGLPGMVKRAVEFPAAAMRGEIDPKSDEGIARAAETGMLFSPMSPASRSGAGWAGAPVKKSPVRPATPTAEELLSTGGFGFDMARQMDVRYTPGSVHNMALKLQSQLFKDGFRAREHSAPETFAELRGILASKEPGAFVSLDDLHAIRRSLQNTAQNFNHPTDQKAAVRVIKAIDDFISNPDPKAVVAGPAAAAGGVWKDAMGNYAAGSRSAKLQGVEESTVRRAKAANSGLNLDNTIRSRVASILDSPAKRSGYSEREVALLETVANGTATRDTLRWVGNLLGGGGGLAAALVGGGTGLTFGGLPGAAVGVAAPAIGLAAKMTSNRLSKGALRKVDTATRQRSPLYEQRVASPEAAPTTDALRMAPVEVVGGTAMNSGMQPPNASPIDPRILAIINAINRPPMTEETAKQYFEQKYAPRQGG